MHALRLMFVGLFAAVAIFAGLFVAAIIAASTLVMYAVRLLAGDSRGAQPQPRPPVARRAEPARDLGAVIDVTVTEVSVHADPR